MEGFFYCCRRTAPELIDTLASRYSWTIHDIEDLDVVDLAGILKKAEEQNNRDRMYAEWVTLQPFMIIKWLRYMPFDEYYDRRTGSDIDMRPADEILAEVEDIKKYVG